MFFGNAAQLALNYGQKAQAQNAAGFNHDLAFELISRIRQLSWIYDQITVLEREYWELEEHRRGPRPPSTNWITVFIASAIPESLEPELAIEDKLRVLVESFYYLAHRLLVILDQASGNLPEMGRVKAEAIRRVRNNLIEHANKSGGRLIYSFSISNAAGVRLRSAAKTGDPDTFLDEGIHINAGQLRDELETMLRKAVAT